MNDKKDNSNNASDNLLYVNEGGEKTITEDQSTVIVWDDVEKYLPEKTSDDEEPPNCGLAAWLVVFGGFWWFLCKSLLFM